MKTPILILEQQSYQGGAQRVLEIILEALREEFHPLVAFPEDGAFVRKLRERQIETLVYPLGRYRPGRKGLGDMVNLALRSLYCGVRLASLIAKRRIQLVYINGPRCLPAGALAAVLTGKPSIFHLHNTLTRRPDVILASRVSRYASRIIACSQAAAHSLLGSSPRLAHKTRVLYNPVSPLKAPRRTGKPDGALSTSPACFVLGMVGRITEEKGHHILLSAVAQLCARLRADVRLLIVGAPAPDCPQDGRYARALKASATELGFSEKILWTGYDADPDRHYAAMDVLVQPSTKFCKEGMPMVVLEALQHGVPVVASRVGGIPEVVQDGVNGFLVPPDDIGALTQALKRILGDSRFHKQLRAGALASIDGRFSAEQYRKTICTLVSELCLPASALEAEPEWEGVGSRE